MDNDKIARLLMICVLGLILGGLIVQTCQLHRMAEQQELKRNEKLIRERDRR